MAGIAVISQCSFILYWFLLGQKFLRIKRALIYHKMWHQPRGARSEPEPVMNCVMNSSTDGAGTRKRSPVTCKLYDARSKMFRSQDGRERQFYLCATKWKKEKKTTQFLLVSSSRSICSCKHSVRKCSCWLDFEPLKENAATFSIDRRSDQVIMQWQEMQ